MNSELRSSRSWPDSGSALGCERAGKLRIGLSEFAGYASAQQRERIGVGFGRSRDISRFIVVKSGIGSHVSAGHAVMRASQPEAFARLVEIKQRQSGQQRVRTAVAHQAFAGAGRADEIDFLDKHARRMFLAKQDYPRHDIIEERRTERTRPAGAALRIIAGPYQIDIGLAVDLAAAQKKRVDAALGGAIEQLDRAVGEKIVLARAEHNDADLGQPARLVARPQQHGASS